MAASRTRRWAITGSTNSPAPQNRNESEASGAAASATVTEYGTMYGQNIVPSVPKAQRKKSTAKPKGAKSRPRRIASSKLASASPGRPIRRSTSPRLFHAIAMPGSIRSAWS